MLPLLLFIFSPTIVALIGLWALRWLQGEQRRKSPMSDKVLRYPGYTLTKKVEELNESLNETLCGLFLLPATAAAVIGTNPIQLSVYSCWAVSLIYICGIGFLIVRAFRLVRLVRQYRMGLKGEQVVGTSTCRSQSERVSRVS